MDAYDPLSLYAECNGDGCLHSTVSSERVSLDSPLVETVTVDPYATADKDDILNLKGVETSSDTPYMQVKNTVDSVFLYTDTGVVSSGALTVSVAMFEEDGDVIDVDHTLNVLVYSTTSTVVLDGGGLDPLSMDTMAAESDMPTVAPKITLGTVSTTDTLFSTYACYYDSGSTHWVPSGTVTVTTAGTYTIKVQLDGSILTSPVNTVTVSNTAYCDGTDTYSHINTLSSLSAGSSVTVTADLLDSSGASLNLVSATLVVSSSPSGSTVPASSAMTVSGSVYSVTLDGTGLQVPGTYTISLESEGVALVGSEKDLVVYGTWDASQSSIVTDGGTHNPDNPLDVHILLADANGNPVSSGVSVGIDSWGPSGSYWALYPCTYDSESGTYIPNGDVMLTNTGTYSLEINVDGTFYYETDTSVVVGTGAAYADGGSTSFTYISDMAHTAGEALTLTAWVRDQYTNRIQSGVGTVSITSFPAGYTSTGPYTLVIGSNKWSYTTPSTDFTLAGTYTVSLSVDGSVMDTATVTVSAGVWDSTQSSIVTDSGTLSPDNPVSVSVILADLYGNTVSSGVTVGVDVFASGSLLGFHACTYDVGSGTYLPDADVLLTVSGSYLLMINIDGGYYAVTAKAIVVGTGAAYADSGSTSYTHINGHSHTAGEGLSLTATVTDAYSNPIQTGLVTVSVTSYPTGYTPTGPYTLTAAADEWSVTTLSTDFTLAGSYTLSISVDGTMMDTATLTVGAGTWDTTQSSIVTDSGTLSPDNPISVSVLLADAYGNTISSGVAVGVDVFVSGTIHMGLHPFTYDSGSGTYLPESDIVYTTADAYLLMINIDGGYSVATGHVITVGTGVVYANAGSTSYTHIIDHSHTAGEALTFTATVADAYSNPIQTGVVSVSITSHPAGYTATGPYTLSAAADEWTYTVPSADFTLAGSYTVSLSVDGSVMDTATVTVIPGEWDSDTSSINVSTDTLNPDNPITLSVTLSDTFGNTIPSGVTVGVSVFEPGPSQLSSHPCSYDSDSQTYTPDAPMYITAAEEYMLMLDIDSSHYSSVSEIITIGHGGAVGTPGSTYIVTTGLDSHVQATSLTLTAHVEDQYGNPVTTGSVEIKTYPAPDAVDGLGTFTMSHSSDGDYETVQTADDIGALYTLVQSYELYLMVDGDALFPDTKVNLSVVFDLRVTSATLSISGGAVTVEDTVTVTPTLFNTLGNEIITGHTIGVNVYNIYSSLVATSSLSIGASTDISITCAGDLTLMLVLDGVEDDTVTASVTLEAGAVYYESGSNLYTWLYDLPIVSGGSRRMVAFVRDAYRNTVASGVDVVVTMTSCPEGYTITGPYTMTAASSFWQNYTDPAEFTIAGEYSMAMTIDGVLIDTATYTVQAGAYAAENCSVNTAKTLTLPPSVPVDISVDIADAAGNTISTGVVVAVIAYNTIPELSFHSTHAFHWDITENAWLPDADVVFDDVNAYMCIMSINGVQDNSVFSGAYIGSDLAVDDVSECYIVDNGLTDHMAETLLTFEVTIGDMYSHPVTTGDFSILVTPAPDSDTGSSTISLTPSAGNIYVPLNNSGSLGRQFTLARSYEIHIVSPEGDLMSSSTTFTVIPSDPYADGTDTYTHIEDQASVTAGTATSVTALVSDKFTNLISTASVSLLISDSPTGASVPTSTVMTSDGTEYTATFTASTFTVAGDYTMSLYVDGSTLALTEYTLTVVAGEAYADIGSSVYTYMADITYTACTMLTLTAYVRDQFENPILDSNTVSVSITGGPSGYIDTGPYTLTHTSDGHYSYTTVDVGDFGLVGSYTISLSVGSSALATSSVTVGVGAFSAANSIMFPIVSPSTADDSLSVSATIADACGNPISSGYSVNFDVWTEDPLTWIGSVPLAYNADVSKYVLDTPATLVGEYLVALKVDTTVVAASAQSLVITHGLAHDGANSSISILSTTPHLPSSDLSLTADIADQFNNPVITGVMSIEVTTGVAGYSGPASIALTHTTAGHYNTVTDSVTLGDYFTLAGDYTLTLMAAGVLLTNTAETLTVVSGTAVADGTSAYSYLDALPDITAGDLVVFTAYVRDTYVNDISTDTVIVKVTSSPVGYTGTTLTLTYVTDAYKLTAAATDFTVTGTYGVCLEVAGVELPLSALEFDVLPGVPYSDGTTTYTFMESVAHTAGTLLTLLAAVRDEYGNSVVDADPVTVSITDGPSGYVNTGPYTLTHAADGQYTASTLDTSDFAMAGSYTISLDVEGSTCGTASITVVPGAFSAAESGIVSIVTEHNPGNPLTLSATLADASGNVISSGVTVLLNVYDSESSLVGSVSLTYSAGLSSYTTETSIVTAAGSYTVTLTVDGTEYPSVAESFTVGQGAVDDVNSSISCPDIEAHVESTDLTLTADIADQFGNPVTSGVVYIEVSDVPTGHTGATSVSMTHQGSGHYTTTIPDNDIEEEFRTLGDYTLTLNVDGVSLPNTAVTLYVQEKDDFSVVESSFSSVDSCYPDAVVKGTDWTVDMYPRTTEGTNMRGTYDVLLAVSTDASFASYSTYVTTEEDKDTQYRCSIQGTWPEFATDGMVYIAFVIEVDTVQTLFSGTAVEITVLPGEPTFCYIDSTHSGWPSSIYTRTNWSLHFHVRDDSDVADPTASVQVLFSIDDWATTVTGDSDLVFISGDVYTYEVDDSDAMFSEPGTVSVMMQVNGNPLECTEIQVELLDSSAAYSNGTDTRTYIESMSLDACAESTLTVHVEDYHGVPITDASSVVVTVTGGPAVYGPFTHTHTSSGTYTATTAATDFALGGTYTLGLNVDGTTLSATSTATVTAVPISEAHSILAPYTETHIPSSSLTISVTLKNSCAQVNPDLTGVAVNLYDTDSNATTVALPYSSLELDYRVETNAITTSGGYTLIVAVDGVEYPSLTTALTVGHGTAYADNTLLESVTSLTAHTAGDDLTLTADVADLFNNPVTSGVVTLEVETAVVGYTGPTSIAFTHTGSGQYVSASDSATIGAIFVLAGDYTLTLTVDGVALTSTAETLTGVPGNAVADGTTTYSYLDQLPAATAGKVVVFAAYIRDTYENEISSSVVTAKVTSSPTGYTDSTLTLTYSGGAYRLTTAASEFTVAGNYDVCLEVDGIELTQSGVSFEVLPDTYFYDGTTSYTYLEDVAHTACSLLTLTAYLRDQFGNGITDSDPLSVSVTEGPGGYVDTGPYSLVHTTDGRYVTTTTDSTDFGVVGTYTITLGVGTEGQGTGAHSATYTAICSSSVTVGVGAVSAADSSIVPIASVHNPD
eukprot:g2519.t1